MRVFAGPNGSGKSTIIRNVREYQVNDHLLDFGIYINADDIAVALRQNRFTFADYRITSNAADFHATALESGLIMPEFTATQFSRAYALSDNRISLKQDGSEERLAQIIADYLRKKLLQKKKKVSFETVFSHQSKLEIMKNALSAGYKLYLYFVSTEDYSINVERVLKRVKEGGHDVPADKIRKRYFNSLNLLYDAAQLAYQAYFFDNSYDKPSLFGRFKLVNGRKRWDEMDSRRVPDWFYRYYLNKAHKTDPPSF